MVVVEIREWADKEYILKAQLIGPAQGLEVQAKGVKGIRNCLQSFGRSN